MNLGDFWCHFLKPKISGADCAQVLLVAVGDNLASLNEMNLRTAIHRLGKIAGRGGSPKIATADRRFEGLKSINITKIINTTKTKIQFFLFI